MLRVCLPTRTFRESLDRIMIFAPRKTLASFRFWAWKEPDFIDLVCLNSKTLFVKTLGLDGRLSLWSLGILGFELG